MSNTSSEFEKQIVAVMRGCGCDAADIYAFKQTGVLINRHRFNSTDSSIAAWRLAYIRYLKLEHDQLNPTESEPPKIPASTLFELLMDPFTQEDERVILACLNSLDAVLSVTPMSVRARTELGCALAALACSAAYDSAEAQDVPDEASKRAEAFLGLTQARIVELLEMMHPTLVLATDEDL